MYYFNFEVTLYCTQQRNDKQRPHITYIKSRNVSVKDRMLSCILIAKHRNTCVLKQYIKNKPANVHTYNAAFRHVPVTIVAVEKQ